MTAAKRLGEIARIFEELGVNPFTVTVMVSSDDFALITAVTGAEVGEIVGGHMQPSKLPWLEIGGVCFVVGTRKPD